MPRRKKKAAKQQFRRDKRDVHGWVVLDKPVGMTSTQAVGVVKRMFKAKRAGHAGTLDPLASGCLPIALGEATKTVPFVMDGRKLYRFTVQLGRGARHRRRRRPRHANQRNPPERGRDPRRAARLHRHHRASPAAIFRHQGRGRARLRSCPRRRNGRARATRGADHRLELTALPGPTMPCSRPNAAKAPMCAPSPAISAANLGCFGHVCALRRVAVGPFGEGP